MLRNGFEGRGLRWRRALRSRMELLLGMTVIAL
jgi:hypothetical protein